MTTAAESKDAEGFDGVPSEHDSDKLSFYETLPAEIWELIFLRLKYEKICDIRLVCKWFDHIGEKMLEKGKTKVENKLAQHVEFSKSQLLTFGYKEPISSKYIFLYLVDNSRNSLCNLFRAFIGKNEECFTLGKMIDFLTTFFVVLENDQLFDCRYLNFLRLLKFWRRTYDKDQMKQMGAFDFCLYMWLKFAQFNLRVCNPTKLLLQHAETIHHWRVWAECLPNMSSWGNICAFYSSYKHAFGLADNDVLPADDFCGCTEQFGDYDEDAEEHNGSLALLTNEHWTPYEPPEMNKECIELFKKYLFQQLLKL